MAVEQVSELESSSSPDAVMRESFCQCVVQAPGLDPMAPGCLCGEEDDGKDKMTSIFAD